ncbi:hypothetical protein ACFUIV_21355 [Streptomyces anulatus]|uniref:phage tail assembly protein T n=1 Tax=Streptomyces anulatus TaxID=1892 RepID=UPI003631313E
MLADIDSAELAEWMAYEHVAGPLGPERGDMLHGILAATVANAARGKGKKAEPKDFIPTWDQGARKQPADWQQMLAQVQAMNRRFGGTDLREGGPA